MAIEMRLVQHPLMLAAMFISAGTVALGLAMIPPTARTSFEIDESTTSQMSPALEELEKRNIGLSSRLDRVEAALKKSQPSTDSELKLLRAEIADLRKELRQSQERQRRIERAVLADPMKSLELPMLRRDIEDSKSMQAKDVSYLTQAIDRVLTITMGSLVAIAIALLLVVADKFWGGRAAQQEPKSR